jgi:siroheme synthase-like protein
MRTHPVFLCLEGRPCVIVGGDAPAETKAIALREAGAAVTVVAPELTPGLAVAAADGRLRHVPRAYRRGDLRGAALAYASVVDARTIAALRDEASAEHVLLNVVDVPAACDFFAGAVVDRGGLQIAIGTGGASPGLAAALRRDLEDRFGAEYGPYVAILGAVRHRLRDRPDRAEALSALVRSPLLDLVRRGETTAIDGLLAALAGDGCSLALLGIHLEEAT